MHKLYAELLKGGEAHFCLNVRKSPVSLDAIADEASSAFYYAVSIILSDRKQIKVP